MTFKTGHFVAQDLREKLRALHLGKKDSLQTRLKKSINNPKPWLGKKIPKEVIERRQNTRLKNAIKRGYWRSKEQRLSNSLTAKGKKRPPRSVEWRENLSNAKIGMNCGSKNPNWKNGETPIYLSVRNSTEYALWRDAVFRRDDWLCRRCGKPSIGNIEAHHVKSFSTILYEHKIQNVIQAYACTELWDVDNGITLCEECHTIFGTKGGDVESADTIPVLSLNQV